jgi:hypothetical protein
LVVSAILPDVGLISRFGRGNVVTDREGLSQAITVAAAS